MSIFRTQVIDLMSNSKSVGRFLQTMLKNRPPYDVEVDAEVAKEFQRLREEKRKVCPDPTREIEAVRTRVSDLEGSVQHLGENVVASHKRLEDMMRTIIQDKAKNTEMQARSRQSPHHQQK